MTEATQNAETQKATFGAGCFWGVRKAFDDIEGVVSTATGFMGGTTDNPTYRQVCSDDTGHAEVVQVEYDPQQVSYRRLLDVFWRIHDPTQFNRQGPDVGDQYRSVIFYHTDAQKRQAQQAKRKLHQSGQYDGQIVTEIVSADTFYRAEEYHQHYFRGESINRPEASQTNSRKLSSQ